MNILKRKKAYIPSLKKVGSAGPVSSFIFDVNTAIAGSSGINFFQLPFQDFGTYNCKGN